MEEITDAITSLFSRERLGRVSEEEVFRDEDINKDFRTSKLLLDSLKYQIEYREQLQKQPKLAQHVRKFLQRLTQMAHRGEGDDQRVLELLAMGVSHRAMKRH